MTDNNITGLSNLNNADYQKQIADKAKQIMGSKNNISLETLKRTPIFETYTKGLDANTKTQLYQRISDIAGKEVDSNEMRTILTLMDANLEQVKYSSTLDKYTAAAKGEPNEKFVMDGQIKLNTQSGIFQATDSEIKKTLDITSKYNFTEEGREVKQEDGSVLKYDNDNKVIGGTTKEGVKYSNEFDDEGNVSKTAYEDGSSKIYEKGKLVQENNADGTKKVYNDGQEYVYDKDGKQTGGKNSELGNYEIKHNEDGTTRYQSSDNEHYALYKDGKLQEAYTRDGSKITCEYDGDSTSTQTVTHDSDKTQFEIYKDGKLVSGRVANGSEYTITYKDDGSFTAEYKNGTIQNYDKDGKPVSSDRKEVEQMKHKEAKEWLESYMKNNSCDEDTAKTNFAQIYGYDYPESTGKKISQFFGKVGKAAGQVGVTILTGLAGAVAEGSRTYLAEKYHMPPEPR